MKAHIGMTSTVVLTALTVGCASTSDTASAAPLMPASFNFGPGTGKYLTISRRIIDQEMQGTRQQTKTNLSYRLSSEVSEAGGQLAAAFVVDSILEADMPGVGTAEIQRMEGRRFQSPLMPTGALTDFPSGQANSPLGLSITNSLRQFFPRIPEGGVGQAMQWADTTENVSSSGMGADLTTKAVTLHESTGWADYEGQPALAVNWSASYIVTGEGEQLGQSFVLEGTGRRLGTHYLGADGQYLGTVATDSATIEVTVTRLGLTVPITQSGADTVRIVH